MSTEIYSRGGGKEDDYEKDYLSIYRFARGDKFINHAGQPEKCGYGIVLRDRSVELESCEMRDMYNALKEFFETQGFM